MAEAFADTKALLRSAHEDIQEGNRLAMAGLAAGTIAMGLYHFGAAEATYAYTLNFAYERAKELVNMIPGSVPLREYMDYATPVVAGTAMGAVSWIVERAFGAGAIKAIEKFPKTAETYEKIRYENGEPPAPVTGFFPRMMRGIRTAQFVLGTGSPGIVLRSKVHEPTAPITKHRAASNRTSNQLFAVNSVIGAVVAGGLLTGEKSGFSKVSATVIDYAQKPWLWAALLGGPPLIKATPSLVRTGKNLVRQNTERHRYTARHTPRYVARSLSLAEVSI